MGVLARPCHTAGMAVPDQHRAYIDRLPIGEQVPFNPDGIPGWEIFPFEGDLSVRALDPPIFPEPPRQGEGGIACRACQVPEARLVWADDDWLVTHMGEPSAVPVMVMLMPRRHHDLTDLPQSLCTTMGPVLVRLATAVEHVPGTGRAHLNKWGDGGAHLHWFVFGRPAGMWQLRGSCLPLWEDALPNMSEHMWRGHLQIVATRMAADGGQPYGL